MALEACSNSEMDAANLIGDGSDQGLNYDDHTMLRIVNGIGVCGVYR